MTHEEAMRYRLTPDFVMRPHRLPTKAEYALSMKILRDFHEGRARHWFARDLTDIEHEVLSSLYRAGILEQSKYTLDHRLTKYGEVYFMQRQDDVERDPSKFTKASHAWFKKRAKATRPKKAPARTFLQARSEILDELQSRGWSLSPRSLKVPHATSPSGKLRLWFKPQAVWFSKSNAPPAYLLGHIVSSGHEMKNAHTLSYDLDIRKMSAKTFVDAIQKNFSKSW